MNDSRTLMLSFTEGCISERLVKCCNRFDMTYEIMEAYVVRAGRCRAHSLICCAVLPKKMWAKTFKQRHHIRVTHLPQALLLSEGILPEAMRIEHATKSEEAQDLKVELRIATCRNCSLSLFIVHAPFTIICSVFLVTNACESACPVQRRAQPLRKPSLLWALRPQTCSNTIRQPTTRNADTKVIRLGATSPHRVHLTEDP